MMSCDLTRKLSLAEVREWTKTLEKRLGCEHVSGRACIALWDYAVPACFEAQSLERG